MSMLSKIWHALLFHPSKGWYNLPKTPSSGANPPGEGPFGAMSAKGKQWANEVTYGGRHATPRFYVGVGIILGAITLVEVWLFNVQSLGAFFVPILLILSAVKFVMVVGLFMHLRFDPKGFSFVFGAGMALGLAVFVSLLTLFFKLNG